MNSLRKYNDSNIVLTIRNLSLRDQAMCYHNLYIKIEEKAGADSQGMQSTESIQHMSVNKGLKNFGNPKRKDPQMKENFHP